MGIESINRDRIRNMFSYQQFNSSTQDFPFPFLFKKQIH